MEADHHILTLNPNLPFALVDRILTAAETALTDGGAARVWVDPDTRAIAVMAELPDPRQADQP
jgi:hypothetical protein